jgi:large subunit ribosomal protein L10
MPKQVKVDAVEELEASFRRCAAALLAEFRGMKVEEMKDLRRTLAAQGGAQFKVVKNTLTRIAADRAGVGQLVPLLKGSTAVAFVEQDPVAAAKTLDEMTRKYPALVVKGGILEGRVLDADGAAGLARVRPREELLSQLLGLLNSPAQRLAVVLNAPTRSLGYALAAYRDKLQGSQAA